MAKVKNVHGEDRIVPWLGDRLVLDGEVVEIPDEDVWAYTMQSGWEPADTTATEIHDTASVVAVAAQILDDGVPVTEPPEDAPREVWGGYVVAAELATADELAGMDRDEIRDTYLAPSSEPGGNAKRDDWAEWVIAQGLATGEDLTDLSRDQIRDTYRSKPADPPPPGDGTPPVPASPTPAADDEHTDTTPTTPQED